ncbi:winged helix-turn-helix domain-containing protein [Nocardia camponoti]|nr:crosslink repair DNA glycosylase YcaQ family protein [Nocardia camponoti]
MQRMSAAAARKIAVAAQGFGKRPSSTPNRRAVLDVVSKTRLLQLDSVSAVVRAHYAPVFARLGSYDRGLLDTIAWSDPRGSGRGLVEYWGHAAALMPIADWPLMRFRMDEYSKGRWANVQRAVERNPTLGADILDVVREVGPASAGEIERHLELDKPRPKGSWWNLSDTKLLCEQLFAAGELSTGTRVNFQRHYDLTERVIPADIRARVIDEAEAMRELVRKASRAHGIATEADLGDYYRLRRKQTTPAIRDLVDAGELVPVEVDGWGEPAYLHPEAATPRRISGTALLCPFDPLIFFRPRTQRIFDFHYRIEIYTPEAKRVHGYYVFPVLLDGQLVGRVDLRADRAAGVLNVPGAFAEPGHANAATAAAVNTALREMADWLELEKVVIGERGDLIELL